jgi:hypothetical protein
VQVLRQGWLGARGELARAPRSETRELAIVVQARVQRRGTADEDHAAQPPDPSVRRATGEERELGSSGMPRRVIGETQAHV